MKTIHNFMIFLIISVILSTSDAISQTTVNFLNSNSRAMSMGGSFTSVYDIDNSPMWNPSISILEKDRKLGVDSKYSHLELDLIPVGLAIVTLLLENLLSDSTGDNTDLWKAIGIFVVYSVRGYTYSKDKFQFYLKLNEDLFDYDLTDTKNFFDNSQSMIAFSFQLGREFALGTSVNYYQTYEKETGRERGFGGSIGLSYNALAVNQLSYGLTYFKFPDNMKDVREKTERIINDSFNLGVSYHYNNDLLVSLDIKDIIHPNNNSFLETHLGLEEKIYKFEKANLYLRQGGYFLNNISRKAVYSFGIGYKSELIDDEDETLYNFSLGIMVNRFIKNEYNLYFFNTNKFINTCNIFDFIFQSVSNTSMLVPLCHSRNLLAGIYNMDSPKRDAVGADIRQLANSELHIW